MKISKVQKKLIEIKDYAVEEDFMGVYQNVEVVEGYLEEIVDNLKELSTIVNNLDLAIKKEEIENPAIVSRIETIKGKIVTVIENLETIT